MSFIESMICLRMFVDSSQSQTRDGFSFDVLGKSVLQSAYSANVPVQKYRDGQNSHFGQPGTQERRPETSVRHPERSASTARSLRSNVSGSAPNGRSETGTRYRYIDDTSLVPITEARKANGTNAASSASGAKTRSRPNNEYVLYSYGEPVGMTNDSGTSYFGTDILGSVRSVTDKYGTLQADYSYDAFGSPYLGNLENDIGFGYCGKVYDNGTGLYDYGFRDYSPISARFTTIDPIRDGSNWFSYVINDPVNYVDPFGLTATDSKSETKGAKNNTKGYTVVQFGEDRPVTDDESIVSYYMILAPQDKVKGATDIQMNEYGDIVKVSGRDKKQVIDYSMDEGGKLSITDKSSYIKNANNDVIKRAYNWAVQNNDSKIKNWIIKNIGNGQSILYESGEYPNQTNENEPLYSNWEKAINNEHVGTPDKWQENYESDDVQKMLQEKYLIKD